MNIDKANNNPTKICTKCKELKALDQFYKNKRSNDGVVSSCRQCHKKWREENRDKIHNYSIKYYQENKEERIEYSRTFRKNNPDKIREQNKEQKQKRKDKRNLYETNLRHQDPIYRLKVNIRSNIYHSFKRRDSRKSDHTEKILGCDINFFVEYLKSKFTEGMCLENYGKWHIDHIVPLKNANTKEDVYKLCHYTNLQPLWQEDNLKKRFNLYDVVQLKFI